MSNANQLNGFFITNNTAKVNYVTYIHQYRYTYCLSEKSDLKT